MWAYYGGGLYNYADGKKITDKFPEQVNFAIWWDGDLLRELLDHDWYGYETGVGIPKIYKWNWRTEETEILLSTDQVLSNNGTKGNPCIQACLFGDWREEAVFRGKNSEFLRIYTTTEPTKCRIYTLMHDAVYRMGEYGIQPAAADRFLYRAGYERNQSSAAGLYQPGKNGRISDAVIF